MPASAAPNVGLNYGYSVGESGWGAGMSYNQFIADWFLEPRALDITNTPPGSPTAGDGYICGTSPTGAWAGKANQVAIYYSSTWYFFPAKSGWRVYVVDEALVYVYNGSVWNKQNIPTPINDKTGAYTLVLADADALIRYNSASGANITVPTNASVAFPIGTTVRVRQVGAGAATIVGGGVTFNGTLVTPAQNQEIWITKVATDTWDAVVM